MKKIFVFIFVALTIGFSACKKCYHCYNTCTQCSIDINGHAFSHTFCTDSFNTINEYRTAIAADSAIGYVCAETAPTYSYDFCSNQSGESFYPNYFNKGKRAVCNEK